jgi:hypothetical protein
MKRPKSLYKSLLLFLLIGGLFLPIIQTKLSLIPVKILRGAIEAPPKDAPFIIQNWFTGNFQEQKEKYLNNSFGFRNIFIRIHNQLEYSFFSKINASNMVIGKDNYLFEELYIKGYYGTDFVGMDSINNIMRRLKYINDTLKKLNKTLLLVFTPNKAAFYPEYIPDKYKSSVKNTNYASYLKLIQESGINYIDFNSYFISLKPKSKYILIPKNGSHWSMYGAALAGDSMVKYIEDVRHITMPKAIWKGIKLSQNDMFDLDIESAMNLIAPLSSPQMAYPDIKFENDSTKTRPNVLVVGDSYYWVWITGYDINNGFSKSSNFWFYNKKPNHLPPSQNELKETLAKQDIIIILATTHNWSDIGWGFIENTFNLYKRPKRL